MKELDQRKIKVLAQLNEPSGRLRTRLVVLWIDGDQARATSWTEQHKFPVGVISWQSPDLKAWSVDPAAGDTTVFVVENHTAGIVTGLTVGGADGLLTRVGKLASKRAEDENPSIKKWASLVARNNSKQPAAPVATAARPQPIRDASLESVPSTQSTGLQLLVAGKSSANVVRFDLANGEATVVTKLANGSKPWSLAVHQAGEIFVGLRGGKRNVVRLVPGPTGDPGGPLVAVDFTGTIGRFGPGLMAFDRRGLLNVAGDTNRAVQRFDVKTGKLVESMRLRAANLVGMTLAGDYLFAAEYFQKTILRFDLNADPTQGTKFIYKSEHLDIPHGMTIGHNGNLFVSNLRNSRVQEFHGETGAFIGTFIDVRTLGGGKVMDLHFEPRLGHYFISSGDAVYELSQDGALLAKHQSDALSAAVAIAVVPAPRTGAAAGADPQSRAGLIGYATIAGTHVPVALRYQHGKVFQPASLVGSVTPAGQTPRDVKLIFRGHLQVPKRMTVKAFVAGGSSNGGHCWLRIGSLRVGRLGDDNKKHAISEIPLDAGDYAIEWTLSGGDFGCGLLKFIDAETSQLLPIQHTRADLRDVPIEREIQVSSDKPGWPVAADWVDSTTESWNPAGAD